jgi:hypothetical protein
VPLSDAARALLAGRPAPARPARAKAKKDDDREPDRTGYRDRARRENERVTAATDTEYWVCFCFRTARAQDRFAAAVAADGRYAAGTRLPAPPPPKGNRAARLLAARSAGDATAGMLASHPLPSPLAGLPGPGSSTLEQESADELAAILAAFTAPPRQDPPDILDSPWWVTAWWPSRQAKDAWLAATGADVLGSKYVDGHKAAAILGISL